MSDPILYDRRIFAENLLRLMRERQERQIDLARLLNVSKSTVSSYCSAQQLPRMAASFGQVGRLRPHAPSGRHDRLPAEAAK